MPTLYINNGQIHSEDETKELFDEMIDESGPVEIQGLGYTRSRIMKEIDPCHYSEQFDIFLMGWKTFEVEGWQEFSELTESGGSFEIGDDWVVVWPDTPDAAIFDTYPL